MSKPVAEIQRIEQKYEAQRQKAYESSGRTGPVGDFMRRGASDKRRATMTSAEVNLWLGLAVLSPDPYELGISGA